MKRFKNEQGITKHHFKLNIVYFCEIGQDYTPATLDVVIRNPWFYPDYKEIENYFKKEIDGVVCTHEGMCRKAFDFFKDAFGCNEIIVTLFTSYGELHCAECVIEG